MLNKSKRDKLQKALRSHCKQYLTKRTELDESGTRLIINALLTDVLGYAPIEEVKTEYMIKGTYADYVVQLKGVRHFLVEAKSMDLKLSDKHLRQAVTYGAFEAIDWALVSNGRHYDLYRIISGKGIDWRPVFSVDLTDPKRFNQAVEALQYLHRASVTTKGLDKLWKKTIALDTANVAGLLYSPTVMNYLKRTVRAKYQHKCSDAEIILAIDRVVAEQIDLEQVSPIQIRKAKRPKAAALAATVPAAGNAGKVS